MKRVTLMIFAAAALAVSCKNTKNTEAQNSATATPTAPETKSQENVAIQTSAPENTAVASNTASDKPELNPPHGQPYHRCDIAVGAPIDSPAPIQNAAPQVAQPQSAPNAGFNTNPISPSLAPPVSSTADIGPKPALNPPHGQPHHRCDLQVGAPLT